MRSFVVTPGFNGVAAGQTATLTLPVGTVTYHKLQVVYNCTNAGNGNQANLEAHITEVRLKVNGKIQRRFSAKQLDGINAFHGRGFQSIGGNAANGAAIEIFLSEPWRRTPQAEDALAWGTADAATFQVEVDIAAAATGPTLRGNAELEYTSRPMGAINKWRSYTQPVAAAGIVTNNTLPKTDAYYALHAFPVANTDIIDVTVTVDQVIRLKGLAGDISALLTHYFCTPQANMFHLVFDRTDRVSDALPMAYVGPNGKSTGRVVGDFRIDWNMNAANSFPFIAQVLGVRD